LQSVRHGPNVAVHAEGLVSLIWHAFSAWQVSTRGSRIRLKLANTQEAFGDLKAVNGPYRDIERQLGIRPEDDSGE